MQEDDFEGMMRACYCYCCVKHDHHDNSHHDDQEQQVQSISHFHLRCYLLDFVLEIVVDDDDAVQSLFDILETD